MRKLQFALSFLFISTGLIAQERLVPLHSNRTIMAAAKNMQNYRRAKRVAGAADTVVLPFLDDFSKPGPYPDTTWWIDKNVYVNYGSPICPPTLGVATFDGLDSIGQPYYPASSPFASLPGDKLTSRRIGWEKPGGGSYALTDSIYLSFYYQAGSYYKDPVTGKTELFYYPQKGDSLLLQFKANGDITWNTIWYNPGYGTADTDTTFHMVMIPFDTGRYIHSMAQLQKYVVDGFQFRFMAYSCGMGNVDHWNIDEVYLNQNRNYVDTTQNDITFSYESPSLLANYTLEPWEQYQPSDLADTMYLYERNNNASANISPLNVINVPYNYYINTPTLTTGYPPPGASDNVDPFVDKGYNKNIAQAHPKLNTANFPASLSGPTTYTITHYFDRSTASDFDFWNDTMRYNQGFSNAYAYDDGSAEYGYSINPIGGGQGGAQVPSYLAYQFNLNKADSIFGLSIYFDYVFVSNTSYTFLITLWNDNGGQPGSVIFQDSVSNPVYGNTDNEFTTYYFKKKPPLLAAGKFYVGWVQTSGDSMNIGFDFSKDNSSKIFYSINTTDWYNCSFNGTLMVRPLMGSYSQYVGINNINEPTAEIGLYPNPAQNEVNISGDMRNVMVRILGADGRVLYENDNFSGTTINTTNLPSGFYIVQVTPKGKETVFKKLLIQR